jgi:hypothetical protein
LVRIFRLVVLWGYEIARLSASAFCTCGIVAAMQHDGVTQDSPAISCICGEILCNQRSGRAESNAIDVTACHGLSEQTD